jgi:hypothetical protein
MLEILPSEMLWNMVCFLDPIARARLAMTKSSLYKPLHPTFIFKKYSLSEAEKERQALKKLEDSRVQERYGVICDFDIDLIEEPLLAKCEEHKLQKNAAEYWGKFNEDRLRSGIRPFITSFADAKTLYEIVSRTNIQDFSLIIRMAAAKKIEVNINTFRCLETYVSDIDATSTNGNTALHWAVLKSNRWVVELLLQNNASTHLQNQDEQTPFHLAALKENPVFVNMLLKATQSKAEHLNIKDKEELTPLELAEKYKRNSCAKALKEFKFGENQAAIA